MGAERSGPRPARSHSSSCRRQDGERLADFWIVRVDGAGQSLVDERTRQPVDRADNRVHVNPIVDSFKPEQSQSSEKRLKGTVVLAAPQEALRRKATTSRRNSTSLLLTVIERGPASGA